jgi:hypothetical protein
MESVWFILDVDYGNYSYRDSSNIAMSILGECFASDIGSGTSFRDWAAASTDGDTYGGNISLLEIENDEIIIIECYLEIEASVRMKLSQFIKLCDEWHNKLYKNKKREDRPRKVHMIHDNGKFWIETED